MLLLSEKGNNEIKFYSRLNKKEWIGISINRIFAMNRFYMQTIVKLKPKEFEQDEWRIANYAKALAHPARIAILKILLERKACICGDIVDELPLSQSTVSQHLKELKDAGLIKGNIEGVRVCYCIDEVHWEDAKKELGAFFEKYIKTDTCC